MEETDRQRSADGEGEQGAEVSAELIETGKSGKGSAKHKGKAKSGKGKGAAKKSKKSKKHKKHKKRKDEGDDEDEDDADDEEDDKPKGKVQEDSEPDDEDDEGDEDDEDDEEDDDEEDDGDEEDDDEEDAQADVPKKALPPVAEQGGYQDKKVAWITNDLAKAVQQGTKESKPILVIFYSENCGECKGLARALNAPHGKDFVKAAKKYVMARQLQELPGDQWAKDGRYTPRVYFLKGNFIDYKYKNPGDVYDGKYLFSYTAEDDLVNAMKKFQKAFEKDAEKTKGGKGGTPSQCPSGECGKAIEADAFSVPPSSSPGSLSALLAAKLK
eukprot:TRINITY_DN19478_c0_g1_i1.p1 TRINITY_DN19478_c0_g1~~TRINITY_DN19478_c0_g1_i1.p1  ORF type:complete len:328 (-),score=146.19 TRINITY_DN19478_c0_g1_i1:185-1168(-)